MKQASVRRRSNGPRSLLAMFPALIAVSAFVPYLSPTRRLRADHLVIYGVASIAILYGRPRFTSASPFRVLAILFLSIAALATVSTAVNTPGPWNIAILSDLDHYLRPAGLALVLWFINDTFGRDQVLRYLRKGVVLVLWLLVAHTALIGLEAVILNRPLLSQYFWSDAGAASTRLLATGGAGRWTGIFAQPIDAGLAYGSALLALPILVFHRLISRRTLLILFPFILLGGFLVGSKVFLASLPLTLMVLLIWRGQKKRALDARNGIVWLALILFSAALLWIMLEQGGGRAGSYAGAFLLRLGGGESLLSTVSAGRLVEGVASDSLLFVANAAPLLGLGLGSLAPLDSGFLAAFSHAGILGLALHLTIWVILFRTASTFASFDKWVLTVLLSLGLATNLGAVAFSTLRGSIVWWLLISLILVGGSRIDATGPRRLNRPGKVGDS